MVLEFIIFDVYKLQFPFQKIHFISKYTQLLNTACLWFLSEQNGCWKVWLQPGSNTNK